MSLGNIVATALLGPLLGVSPEVTLAATMRPRELGGTTFSSFFCHLFIIFFIDVL